MAENERLIDRLIAKMEAMTLEERASYIRRKLENGPARAVHEAREEMRVAAAAATCTARSSRVDDGSDSRWLNAEGLESASRVVVESEVARNIGSGVDDPLYPAAA
jgi:hypothetical protein